MRSARMIIAAAAAIAVASADFNSKGVYAVESRELFRLDCLGVAHFLKNTPLETDIDANFLKSALETFRDRIKERVETRCPDITDEEINRRFVPSLDMALNVLFGYENRNTATQCEDEFVNGIQDLGSFISMILGGSCSEYNVLPDISNLFPETCSHESWTQDGTCFLAGKFQDVVGGFEIDIAAAKCEEDSAWPFFSVNCQGPACTNFLKPCTGAGTSQCGSELTCTDLADLIEEAGDIEDGLTDLLAQAGFWHSSIPSSYVWDSVVKPLRTFWAGYFSGSQVGVQADYLKFCLPKPEYNGDTFDNVFEMLEDIMYWEEETTCHVKYECQGNITFPENCEYKYYEYGCNENGIRIDRYFNASRLFKTNDGSEISCSTSQTKTWFESDCTKDGLSDYECPLKYREIVGDSNGNPYKCHDITNGLCGFHRIGDGFCDEACNIAECVFDGGDCAGPATVYPAGSQEYYCDASNKQTISPSSGCVDPDEQTYCLNILTNFERGDGRRECFGYQRINYEDIEIPMNEYCCVCNTSSIFMPQTKNNMFSKFNEIGVTCNTVHSWNGMIGTESILDRKDDSTGFPYESYKPGESQLLSLDCNGFVMGSFVSPLFRAKATGPLATLKTAEKIIINVAKLRQEEDPGGTFVGGDGLFTKLGYQNFGFFTPAYALWQLTPALREEARGSSFTKYEGTTPGTKLMRDWNPDVNDTNEVTVAEMPSTCTFSKYVTDRTCFAKYEVPILKKIGVDLTFKAGISSCPNTHVPEVVLSLAGSWLDPFPFMKPCLSDANCPSSHQCVNLFHYVKDIPFTATNLTFAELEYDLLTFFLHGKSGRKPNWPARTLAWATEDVVYILKKLYGVLASPNPFQTTPNYAFGEVKLCFPDNDPFLVPLITNGQPYDWETANQGVVYTTPTVVSSPNFHVPMKKVKLEGLSSLTTPPIGLGEDNTLPPTQSPSGPPTEFDDDGEFNAAQGKFNGITQYMLASVAVIVSFMLLGF